MQNLSSGSAIPGIGRESILNFLCPLIDENEQNEIVLEIEKQISVIETLEQNIRHSQAHAIVLRQNILDKAYQGKLIGASNTGDTKSLLEQIKVEKKDYITKKQNTKRTPKVRSIMSQNKLTILEVLQSSKKPMLAKDVWEKSKHDDIEEFYAALKKLQDAVVEIDKGFLALVK